MLASITFDFENYLYSAFISLLAGLFAIAFPLSFQAIQRLKDEYRTDKAIEWFEAEGTYNDVRILLIFNIILAFIVPISMFLVENFWCKNDKQGEFFEWSFIALSLQMAFLISLVIFFFRLMDLIFTYSSTLKLAKRTPDSQLEKLAYILRNSSANENKAAYDISMSKIAGAFTEFVANEHQQSPEQPIVLCEPYLTSLRLIFDAATKPEKYPVLAQDNTILYILYDCFCFKLKISDDTYQQMWYWMNKISMAKNSTWLNNYWEIALQYYTFSKWSLTDSEKEKFIEFHYFFCSLLLSSKNEMSLFFAFSYRNSYPENSPLIPSSFQQIIDSTFRILHLMSPFYLSSHYSMFTISIDAMSERKIQGIFEEFMTLCILRLPYNKSPYQSDAEMRSLVIPNEYSIGDIQQLKNLLHTFIAKLGSSETFMPYFKDAQDLEARKIESISMVNEAIKLCDNTIADIKNTNDIDTAKIEEVKADIVKGFKSMSLPIKSMESKVAESSTNFFICTETNSPIGMVMKRQGISVAGFTECLIGNFKQQFTDRVIKFLQRWSPQKTYTIQYKNLKKALDKLQVNKDFVLYDVGCNLFRYVENGAQPFVDDEGHLGYKGMEIIEIPSYTPNNTNYLLLLKKFNQPTYEYQELDQNWLKQKGYQGMKPLEKDSEVRVKIPTSKDDMIIGLYANVRLNYPRFIKLVRLNLITDIAIGAVDLNEIKPFDDAISV